jgi:thymidine kinase
MATGEYSHLHINPYGSLTIYYGPMKAGKTEQLKSILAMHSYMGHKVLLVSTEIDKREELRNDGVLSTHNQDSSTIPACVTQVRVRYLGDLDPQLIIDNDVVAIDEAQFFEDIEIVIDWIDDYHKKYYVTGLMSDSDGNMFGNFYKILPHCDNSKELYACCPACQAEIGNAYIFTPATMTKCLVKKDQTIMVGSDKYIPLCRRHWSQWDNLGYTYNKITKRVEIPR